MALLDFLFPPKIRYRVVERGDTLATLAQLYYGDKNLVGVIYNANRHYIENPNQLLPGQKLAIPHLRDGDRNVVC